MNASALTIEPSLKVVLPEVARTCIVQVGVGGTGSWLAMALARVVYHARQKGQAIDLILVDPDTVEARNVGRQAFSPSEIGCNKAESMAFRLNLALGLDIIAVPAPFVGHHGRTNYTADENSTLGSGIPPADRDRNTRVILVGAVDNHWARREIACELQSYNGSAWAVDCGNARANGQVVAGNLTDLSKLATDKMGLCSGLPSPYLQEPGLLEPDPVEETPLSCAELTRREEQSLLINSLVAPVAAQFVFDLAVARTLNHFAVYFSLEPPAMSSRLITAGELSRFKPVKKKDRKKDRNE
jgi:PRTRC genetic system ThiF family protein